MDSLLVIGGSGLVGAKVASKAVGSYKVTATHRGGAPSIAKVTFVELEKKDVDAGRALIRKVKPVAVVDTAALHNVDKCEEDRDLAWTINAGATGSLAHTANDVGARYLFISTDFVFDGRKGAYREEDHARPVNVYGETKLAGERATLAANPENLVVRPSVVYGWNDTRTNFATWVLTSLRGGTSVKVITDWIGSPTWADSLAEGILKLLNAPSGGIYHLAGPDAMSRYDFAARLAKAFGLDDGLIQPVLAKDMPMKAPRPPNSSLVNLKGKGLRIAIVGVDAGIAGMKAERTLEDFVTPERFKS
jgi:dTDP-4-dehydrorhamnose reductase